MPTVDLSVGKPVLHALGKWLMWQGPFHCEWYQPWAYGPGC